MLGTIKKEKYNPKLGPSTFDRKITGADMARSRGEVRQWARTLSQELFAVLTKTVLLTFVRD